MPGEYAVGWAKRGPSGVIGTNKPDAVETVKMMMEDVKGAVETGALNQQSAATDGQGQPGDIVALLQEKGVAFVSFADWQILEQIENEQGARRGQPRVKITDVEEMLRLIRTAKEGGYALIAQRSAAVVALFFCPRFEERVHLLGFVLAFVSALSIPCLTFACLFGGDLCRLCAGSARLVFFFPVRHRFGKRPRFF